MTGSGPNDPVDRDEDLSRGSEKLAQNAALTDDDEATRKLVKANRHRIDELRQRRYGVSLTDNLSAGWLIAAMLLAILAFAVRAVTRALPLEGPLVLAGSIALVLLIALGLSVKKRLISRHRERP